MAAPKLRFKEFDGDWTLSELDDHIHESKASSKIQDEYEVLTSSRRGLIRQADYFENSRLTDRENIGFNIIEPDQITYRSRSDDGFFFFNLNGLGITGIISTYYPVFTMKKGNNWFLNELLNYHKYKYIQYAVGTSQLVLSLNQLRKIKFNIPCLDEQTKIASFLSAVDEKISQLTQKHALLSQYKQGMMQKLFSQQIRFKADDGSEFVAWGEQNIGEVGEVITGKTPSTSDADAWNGDILFVTPTDMNGNKYQPSTARTVSNNQSKLLPKNTIMFTCIASIGKMSLSIKPCITNQQINSIIVKMDNPEFIYYQLLNMVDYIKSTQANTTLPIINKTEFSKFVLQIPQYTEQTKIANFLSAIDKKIEVVAQQIEQAKLWKKGLLQQMFV